MKTLFLAAGLALASCSPAFAFDPNSEADWAALSESEKVAHLISKPDVVKAMAPIVCTAAMSIGECLDAIREAVTHEMRVVDQVRDEQEKAERRAALPHHDPGAIDMCPPPHRMTRDGCE